MNRLAKVIVPLCFLTATAAMADPTEANLRQADAEQMRIIVEEDVGAQQSFMHPNYIINSPANEVQRKQQVVERLARGQLASESFEREIEGIAITDRVGVVMGREMVTPAADSRLGKLYPGMVLERRFTNVFLWEDGRWQFLARHASIVKQ